MQARPASLRFGILTALCLGIVGFGVPTTAAVASGATAAAVARGSQAGAEEVLDTGEATWYGGRHQGLRTFSGERFDSRQMTAAHPSLPIGTMVRVTDVATGRSIIVRVNDREPPHGVRCIDLSEGAAMALGIHNRGVAEVTLTAVTTESPSDTAPVEVAEAPDDLAAAPVHAATARHGRQHRRRAAR